MMFGLSVISLPAIPVTAGYAAVVVGAAALYLYWRHTTRTPHPLLDPTVFRNRLFRASIIGSSLFRIGVGATPFLLPLMLQLSFGLTPFESGMITFIGALGAITSKFVAERVFAAGGFPRVLIVASVGACVLLAIHGFFTPETPRIYIYLVLLVTGLLRSIFFTGVNALGFADVDEHETSQATAITAVSQQLSVAFGVAVAGGVLEMSSHITGGGLSLVDFHIAWFVVAAISLLSALPFLRMPPDAGSDVSGHRRIVPEPIGRDEKLG
jgi:Na+/melibiose symporter-like transporter